MYRAAVAAAAGGVRPPNTRPPYIRGLPRGAPSLGPRPAPGPSVRPAIRGQFPVRGRFMPPGPAGRPLRPRGGGVAAAPAARGFAPPQPPVRYSARPPRAMMRGAHSMPRAPAGMLRPAPVAPPPQPEEDPEPQPWEHYYQLD
jgi:hypothetical protein